MEFQQTDIPEVILIHPDVHRDERGYFMEVYQKERYFSNGVAYEFVQDNQSSSIKGTLRGLHYQLGKPQGKLVRVLRGEIFDVAVDLRKKSPFFGKWVGQILSAENQNQLWIPPGFGHGFYTLSDQADVFYKATDYYYPEGERCIRWDDAEIGIDWPISDSGASIVSKKDSLGSNLTDAEVYL